MHFGVVSSGIGGEVGSVLSEVLVLRLALISLTSAMV
jgi:hypothetical protein